MILSARRGAHLCAALLLSFTCSCATMRRDSRLRRELDEHAFQKPLSEIWPAALRLLADHDYDLVGNDRAVVAQPEGANVLRRGFETRVYSDHRRAMETMQNASGVRYRMEGVETSRGCRIVFFAFRRSDVEYDKWKYRDIQMELALVHLIEPEAADRMKAAMER